MSAWLVKTEPGDYSYGDLQRDGTTHWDGVTNAQAQLNLRAMTPGDAVVVYHSQSDKAAVGLAEVVGAPYPDPTDPDGKRVWVDVRAVRPLERPVTLTELKAELHEVLASDSLRKRLGPTRRRRLAHQAVLLIRGGLGST